MENMEGLPMSIPLDDGWTSFRRLEWPVCVSVESGFSAEYPASSIILSIDDGPWMHEHEVIIHKDLLHVWTWHEGILGHEGGWSSHIPLILIHCVVIGEDNIQVIIVAQLVNPEPVDILFDFHEGSDLHPTIVPESELIEAHILYQNVH